MNGNVSILTSVPVEHLSVSRFVVETAAMLMFLSYQPMILGAIYAAMTLSCIDRLRSAEFKEVANPMLRFICFLDLVLGVVLAVGLIGQYNTVIGIGFMLTALSYGIRSAMSQEFSTLLSTFQLIYCVLGCILSYMYLGQVDLFQALLVH